MSEAEYPILSVLQRLRDKLWSEDGQAAGEQVYLLLDGARDPAIVPWLEQSPLASACLYSGVLTANLKAAAPWLVQLPAGAPPSLELLRLGWGRAWGILIVVPATVSMAQLRLHLKKFLRVITEEGRQLMFRFYDPRVLSVFLPTCDEGQFKALLGPCKRWIVEGEAGQALQVFHAWQGSLVEVMDV